MSRLSGNTVFYRIYRTENNINRNVAFSIPVQLYLKIHVKSALRFNVRELVQFIELKFSKSPISSSLAVECSLGHFVSFLTPKTCLLIEGAGGEKLKRAVRVRHIC